MVTSSFEVAFRFEGRLADEGVLDGSDHEATTQAVRRLLALHAHCFLHGKVPSAALSDGNGYHVQHVATRMGSHIDVWNVVINNPWTIQVVGGVMGTAYANEVKAGINASARFLRDSVRSALGTGSVRLPEFKREQNVLEARDGNREPMIDIDAEIESERIRLRGVTIRVLQDVARPIGRSAARVTIIIEEESVAVIDEDTKRCWLSDEIGTAVMLLRDRRRGLMQPTVEREPSVRSPR